MNRKKVLLIILTLGITITMSFIITKYLVLSDYEEKMKVMAYIPSAEVNERGYQIDKYEKIKSIAWLSNNEVLTLTSKDGQEKDDVRAKDISYCSIYNLNTKMHKDFQDVDIADFLGVSEDKRYVLYGEKIINLEGNFHKNIKALDLFTGEITDVDTEMANGNAELRWLSGNYILVNYLNKWAIINLDGEVNIEGNYENNSGYARLTGVDDIKNSGDNISGKFYYTQIDNEKNTAKICSIDIITRNTKMIYKNDMIFYADKKGKNIIADYYKNNGKKSSNGVYLNRSFGLNIIDDSGEITKSIDLPMGRMSTSYVLSPDGSKAVYVEGPNGINLGNKDKDFAVKVVDIKTGEIKEIIKDSGLIDKNTGYTGKTSEKTVFGNISNINWDDSSRSFSFTYGSSNTGDYKISTYIVTLDN
ncbi:MULTISPECIES: hypothetical protein [Clostridium]|uniref:Protein TolB n=1 Tax=Clostridium cibarium TaxID=2762247 RepID=A0ABR8PRQ1_9CLOT|nr:MULTISPECIES: hypothetical protein [Clostridium]MBD7910837.1 hypothetical protein [Clostridium cibarium]